MSLVNLHSIHALSPSVDEKVPNLLKEALDLNYISKSEIPVKRCMQILEILNKGHCDLNEEVQKGEYAGVNIVWLLTNSLIYLHRCLAKEASDEKKECVEELKNFITKLFTENPKINVLNAPKSRKFDSLLTALFRLKLWDTLAKVVDEQEIDPTQVFGGGACWTLLANFAREKQFELMAKLIERNPHKLDNFDQLRQKKSLEIAFTRTLRAEPSEIRTKLLHYFILLGAKKENIEKYWPEKAVEVQKMEASIQLAFKDILNNDKYLHLQMPDNPKWDSSITEIQKSLPQLNQLPKHLFVKKMAYVAKQS